MRRLPRLDIDDLQAAAPSGRRPTVIRSAAPARRALAGTLALAALAAGAPARAQVAGTTGGLQTGGVTGVVRDTAGAPLAGVQVMVAGLFGRGGTGSDGSFTLVAIPIGDRRVIVRRLGFRPETVSVTVPGGGRAEVNVRMMPVPQQIAAVVVEAGRPQFRGRLREFYERRDHGMGRYFTAEDIDKRNPQVVTDLLRSVPGLQLTRRGSTSVVTFRNQRCTPLIWLDGAAASTGYLDVDAFQPNTLAGIEVYAGPATVPPELMGVRGAGSCGVIALWTRLQTPLGREPKRKVSAQELANLVASVRLYSVDQVDVPAAPDTTAPVRPIYPDSLQLAGVDGRVLVEFVVDTTGEADLDTFGEILSTHPLFTRAVQRAVGAAHFTPARLDGRAVRQVVQLPIVFVAVAPPAREP